jgi:predicted RND superfamily exporter protein
MSATGVPIYSVSTMMPVMLIAIGVAYGIYFYNHFHNLKINMVVKLLKILEITVKLGFI